MRLEDVKVQIGRLIQSLQTQQSRSSRLVDGNQMGRVIRKKPSKIHGFDPKYRSSVELFYIDPNWFDPSVAIVDLGDIGSLERVPKANGALVLEVHLRGQLSPVPVQVGQYVGKLVPDGNLVRYNAIEITRLQQT